MPFPARPSALLGAILLLLFPRLSSADDAPRVVASIMPVHSLTAAVMGEVGSPHLLVRGAGSPHDYALRPSDARALVDADLVFWVDPGLETFLEKPLASISKDSQVIRLSSAPNVRLLAAREGGAWETRGHDDDHEDPGDPDGHDDHEGHVHGTADLHLWLDPANARALVDAIEDALAAVDPGRAPTYRANATATRAALSALEAELRGRLAPVADRPFVVFHDAFQYAERTFGLHAAGAITIAPEQRPGPRRLSEIRARIVADGAVCVFAEPQFPRDLVATVVEGTPARIGILDPLGADRSPGPDSYFRMMRALAEGLRDCLEG